MKKIAGALISLDVSLTFPIRMFSGKKNHDGRFVPQYNWMQNHPVCEMTKQLLSVVTAIVKCYSAGEKILSIGM